MEAFQIDVTTRPMINFVWLGTLLMFAGGLMSMRRRILENRAVPIPDLPEPERKRPAPGRACRQTPRARAPSPRRHWRPTRGKGR